MYNYNQFSNLIHSYNLKIKAMAHLLINYSSANGFSCHYDFDFNDTGE